MHFLISFYTFFVMFFFGFFKQLFFFITKLFKARGKTNTELREEFVLAAGVSQTMQAFTPRPSISSASPSKVSFPVHFKELLTTHSE